MTNYYDILGITLTASASEIKSAFRVLAKIYHPDINPGGQEEFKKILRAYETLSNPHRKSSYDLKLQYHQASTKNPYHAKTKTWSFEEKELKRRQYYNEHIKKYEKIKKTQTAHAELKNNYNEYKYMLYATPVAVALFLVVIHFATPSHRTKTVPAHLNLISQNQQPDLEMGDAPYTEYFGQAQYATNSPKTLSIKNNTGTDLIVCLFSENNFIRSCFIKEAFYVAIPQLPSSSLQIRYQSGKKWEADKSIANIKTKGIFTKHLTFYKSIQPFKLGAINEITLRPFTNQGFEVISAAEFFKKENT